MQKNNIDKSPNYIRTKTLEPECDPPLHPETSNNDKEKLSLTGRNQDQDNVDCCQWYLQRGTKF